MSASEAKKTLRRSMKASLAKLCHEDVCQQSKKAQAALLALPEYRNAKRIGIYLHMPSGEAHTDLLIQDAFAKGKTIFVPYIYKPLLRNSSSASSRKIMDMLRLRSETEWHDLSRDAWGIPSLNDDSVGERENAFGGRDVQPDEDQIMSRLENHAYEVRGADSARGLDLIVVPGVAFDRCMNRLGHGAGFYDYYLARLRDRRPQKLPFLVGLCLTEQFLPDASEIPVTHLDWPMDAVAVGNGAVLRVNE